MSATSQPAINPFYVEANPPGGPVHLFMFSNYYPMGGIGDYEGMFWDTQPDFPAITRYLQSEVVLLNKHRGAADYFSFAEALVVGTGGKLVCIARWDVEDVREDFQERTGYVLKRSSPYMIGRGKYADQEG